MMSLQDLRLETAYEHHLLCMASEQLGWCLRTKDFCVRGIQVHEVAGKLVRSAFRGPPVPALDPRTFHIESPAPWIQQFVPLLITTAHKLLELVLTWILKESGIPADGLTAGQKRVLYLQKLAVGSLTAPLIWSSYPAIHESTVRTWEAFTPVRNDSVHRGGVALGTWGDLTVRSQTGPRTLTGEEVTAFCLLAINTIEAMLAESDTCDAACWRSAVVAALEALTTVSGLPVPTQPKEYWVTTHIYLDRANPASTVVRWGEICDFALQEDPPFPDELRRFELVVELSGGGREHRTVRAPSGFLAHSRNMRFDEESNSWIEV